MGMPYYRGCSYRASYRVEYIGVVQLCIMQCIVLVVMVFCTWKCSFVGWSVIFVASAVNGTVDGSGWMAFYL